MASQGNVPFTEIPALRIGSFKNTSLSTPAHSLLIEMLTIFPSSLPERSLVLPNLTSEGGTAQPSLGTVTPYIQSPASDTLQLIQSRCHETNTQCGQKTLRFCPENFRGRTRGGRLDILLMGFRCQPMTMHFSEDTFISTGSVRDPQFNVLP